jgi:hypothetical protein
MILVRRSAQQTFQTTQFPLLLFDQCQCLSSYNKLGERICMDCSDSKQGGYVAMIQNRVAMLQYYKQGGYVAIL